LTDEQMKIDLSDNVFMGNVDVQQNIMNIGECPSCSASNVKVMKCQEKQCTSKKFCELCHTNSRFFEGRFERFDSGHGSGPLCVMCLSSTWKQYEDKKRLERERVEKERAERERIESERQRERMEVERLKIERAEIKTALYEQKREMYNRKIELEKLIFGNHTKERLAEEIRKEMKKQDTEMASVRKEAKKKKISLENGETELLRTKDLAEKMGLGIFYIGIVISFFLPVFIVIPFDDIGVSSECSETGGIYDGEKYDSVEECQEWEWGLQSCCIYVIIATLFAFLPFAVMTKINEPKVRLINRNSKLRDGSSDMHYLMRKHESVERVEKEISELELSIAISEQKFSQAEIKLYAWNSDSITREGYNTCAICSTETSLLLSECIACAFGEEVLRKCDACERMEAPPAVPGMPPMDAIVPLDSDHCQSCGILLLPPRPALPPMPSMVLQLPPMPPLTYTDSNFIIRDYRNR
jgi:hypothetical protein